MKSIVIDFSESSPLFNRNCDLCWLCEMACPRGAIEFDFAAYNIAHAVRPGENIIEKTLSIFEERGRFRRLVPMEEIGWELTFPQYNALRVLDGSEAGQNTISNIGKVLLGTGANMTGFVKRLEKNGFLLRKGDPKDERVTLLEITPRGRQTLNKKITESKDSNIEHYLKNFTDEEKDLLLIRLKTLLKK